MKKAIIITILLAILLFSIGCSNTTTTYNEPLTDQQKAKAASDATVKASSLTALKSNNTVLTQGSSEDNTLMLKNAYNKKMSFKIAEVCQSDCLLTLNTREVSINPKSIELIPFKIKGNSKGTFTPSLKITDQDNNTYAVVSLSVKII